MGSIDYPHVLCKVEDWYMLVCCLYDTCTLYEYKLGYKLTMESGKCSGVSCFFLVI